VIKNIEELKVANNEFNKHLLSLATRWIKARPSNDGYGMPQSVKIENNRISFFCRPASPGLSKYYFISDKYLDDDLALEEDSLKDYNEEKLLIEKISFLKKSKDVLELQKLEVELSNKLNIYGNTSLFS